MLSEQQYEKKLERIRLVVDSFLSNNVSITELATFINISKSTIQRDLNDIEYIREIYGGEAKDILKRISDKLKKNKENGLSRGGINSTTNNEPIRDANGKFTGNKKR